MKTYVRCLKTKPLSEFWNHSNKRRPTPIDGKLSHCKSCGDIDRRVWYRRNKVYALRKRREWNAAHPEVVKRQNLAKKLNPKYKEWQRLSSEKYRRENREMTNKRVRDWTARNPDKHCLYQNRRRAAKLQAIPKWANDFFISEIYHLAKLRTKITGYQWHVDHIVPLQSPIVCGLHVENNLQVIPSKSNISKGNRIWPNMPEGV